MERQRIDAAALFKNTGHYEKGRFICSCFSIGNAFS